MQANVCIDHFCCIGICVCNYGLMNRGWISVGSAALGSIAMVTSSLKFMCDALWCCWLVVCKLNMCVYARFLITGCISVCSVPAIQALWYKMYRIRQSLRYLYNLCAGYYECYGEFETLWPYSSSLCRN